MKILLKLAIGVCLLLFACTDKKAGKSNENEVSAPIEKEVIEMEQAADAFEKSTQSIEKIGNDLDALLEEIDK